MYHFLKIILPLVRVVRCLKAESYVVLLKIYQRLREIVLIIIVRRNENKTL